MYWEFISIFLLSLGLIWLLRYYAPKIGLLDIPNERSMHLKHMPIGGGIGFFLAVVVTLFYFSFELFSSYPWTIAAILCVFLIGVLDDHHDASPNMKFFVLIVATVFLSFDGILINHLGTAFGMEISLGWVALPFTIFAVVGFTNALNLIDGLDGLAATISLIILSTFFVVGYTHDDAFIMVLSGSFMAGVLAFLVFNWHPATIFMGDSGSLTLGFIIAILAIQSLAYIPAVSILFIAAIPIMDTVIVMTRRKLRGRSMFSADRCHIHHLFRHFFLADTPKTVFVLGILQATYSITGLQLDKEVNEGYLLVLFILNMILLYLLLAAMIKRQKKAC